MSKFRDRPILSNWREPDPAPRVDGLRLWAMDLAGGVLMIFAFGAFFFLAYVLAGAL